MKAYKLNKPSEMKLKFYCENPLRIFAGYLCIFTAMKEK